MKKTIIITALLLVILVFTGCENIFNSGKAGSNSAPATGDEPTQSSAAQKLYQFALPNEGDTVAEIAVEGYGTMYMKLFSDIAPKAVENFVTHAKEGYYDGMIFHRVIADFMIQSGDPTGTGYGGESIWGEPFEDEFGGALYPFRGALCMANAGSNTNGSQFFVVQANAQQIQEMKEYVEYKGYTLAEYLKAGYSTELSAAEIEKFELYGGAPWLTGHHTVFGQLYEGFEVLDAISKVQTNSKDKPLEDVKIQTIKITTFQSEQSN